MRHLILAALLFAGAAMPVCAKEASDNARLAAIYEEDQEARQSGAIDWTVVAAQDRAHRAEVLGMIKAGRVRTANDHFHAAMVFQHGEEFDDFRLAFGLAQIAATLDPEMKHAKWLTAATWDRMLMSKKRPQWYGTQYQRPEPDAPMGLYQVDETVVTDAERKALGVPSLQEAKDFERKMQGDD